MTDDTIWEAPVGQGLLRLSIREYRGRTFADLRRFYRSDGEWKHSPKGCAVPLASIGSLGAAMMAWASGNAPDGPENGTSGTS